MKTLTSEEQAELHRMIERHNGLEPFLSALAQMVEQDGDTEKELVDRVRMYNIAYEIDVAQDAVKQRGYL